MKHISQVLLLFLGAVFLFLPANSLAAAEAQWQTLITPQLLQKKIGSPSVLIIDVRSKEEYLSGHIPGAINLPASKWRTAKVAPGAGDSQYIFRKANGKPDVNRYEKFLGAAGLVFEHDLVVYGNHAGKKDGSLPALILYWLGHRKITFLDGIGLTEWENAGFPVSREARRLSPAKYRAKPIEGFVWRLDDVLANLKNEQVVFYDTRSRGEFLGKDLRKNKRGGHIPGALLIDYADFINKETKKVIPKAEVEALLAKSGVSREKKIVLYCQTATRVSLPLLVLKELGYPDVVVYDASWHEYGNRDDTPVELRH